MGGPRYLSPVLGIVAFVASGNLPDCHINLTEPPLRFMIFIMLFSRKDATITNSIVGLFQRGFSSLPL